MWKNINRLYATYFLLPLFLINLSCKYLGWDLSEKGAYLFCNVYDSSDSSFVENPLIYHVWGWENQDTSNQAILTNRINNNTYALLAIGGINEGYLMVFHDDYISDTLKTERIKVDEEATYNFYLLKKQQ